MPFSVILTEKGGSTQRLDFESEEITIGRVDENDICLPKGNISKKHTKIVVKDGKIIVLDLKSTNGTYVNGKKLAGPQVIQPHDKVYIGDFILNVEPPDLGAVEAPAGEPVAEEPVEDGAPVYDGDDATRRVDFAPADDPAAEEDAMPTSAPGALRRSPVASTTPSPKPFAKTPAPARPAPAKPAAGKPAPAKPAAGKAAAAKPVA